VSTNTISPHGIKAIDAVCEAQHGDRGHAIRQTRKVPSGILRVVSAIPCRLVY
jgi:hypothetical protein